MKTTVNLELLEHRYHNSSRAEKTQLLNELCDLHGYNRKYLLQVFNRLTGRQYVKRGRRTIYKAAEVAEPLKRIWLACDQICSKKLKAAIPAWLPFYNEHYEELPPDVASKLLTMSASTIDRLLKPYRAQYKHHGLAGTKPGFLLKNQIPIKTDHWDITKPGYLETDTVAHCGNSIAGDFVWSLTLTDILTGWTENRACWNKGASGVIDGIKDAEKHLPFSILGFDCDNGCEFLNWHLLRYLTEGRKRAVQFTRSRPYHKNDNAHVEQKNWTHVRQLFGYDRFENQKAVALMNDLYRNEWNLYQNHFIPTMKLLEKIRVGSKYKKTYGEPVTPYQRVIASKHVSDDRKQHLREQHKNLDPFELKKQIENKLKVIFVYATPVKKPRVKI